MSRKQQLISGQITPEVENPKDEELEHFDKQEVQEDILQPTSQEITLIDGKVFYLPYEFTLKDIYRNKITNSLKYFYFLLQSELKQVRGDKLIELNDPLQIAILFKSTIQEALAELLAAVTKQPVHIFQDTLDDKATVAVFGWVIKAITNLYKPSENGKPEKN